MKGNYSKVGDFVDLIYPITLEIKDTAIQLGTDSEAG
jgi:hypothetical protein